MIKHMKKTLFLSFAALFFAGTVYADFVASDWQFVRPIDTASVSMLSLQSAYVKLDVPRSVSTLARADLADLRIVSSGTEEVPYQLVIEDESVRSEYVQSTLRDLSLNAGETMFILDVGAAGTIHDHLVIDTLSKNFKRPVFVYASDTALHHGDQGWRLLSDKNHIYNYSDPALGFDAGSTDVYYPESTSRYLRIVIGKGEGSEVVVQGARVLRILERDARKNRSMEPAVISQNAKERSTEITIDLGGSGVSTRKLTLATSDVQNFSRRVVVQGSDDAGSWTMLSQGYVFQLNTPLFVGSDLSISYPESAKRYIRVIVFDEDNKPINWTDAVEMEGIARSLVFAVTPGATYALYYGNPSAERPVYDIARYFKYFEGVALSEALMGEESMNAAYVPPKAPVLPFSERNKNVINGVLILLVALVSFLLVAYLKKLKLMKPEK